MDEILVNNFMVFDELVRTEHYDAWVADEGWDVDYFLHENPELKSSAYVWLTDFVGWLPMPDGGEPERRLTSDYNAEMIEQVARFPRLRDRALFVGDADDCVARRSRRRAAVGPRLDREHTSTSPATSPVHAAAHRGRAARRARRARLGDRTSRSSSWRSAARRSVRPLLRRAVAAYPLAAAAVPGLRMVVVAGPRIDPASLRRRRGRRGARVRTRPLPGARRQRPRRRAGRSTTCMELVANRRPFLYVPLRHHFEQTFHVPHRLARYGAGRRLDYDDTAPEAARRGDRGRGRPADLVRSGRHRRRRPSGAADRRADLTRLSPR